MSDDFEKSIMDLPDETGKLDFVKDSFKSVASTRQGRRFLYHLLIQSGYKCSTFHEDSRIHAFNEGQRNVGLWVENLMAEFCPETETLMVKEAKEDLTNDNGTK